MKVSGRFAIRKFMAVESSFTTFDPSNSESIFRNTPTVKLLSTAFLFKVLSNTTAVNFFTRHVNTIFLQSSDSVIKLISGYTMKRTIFPYFCAGENFLDCMSLAKTMHEDDKILTIADHSSEDLDDEVGFDSNSDQKVELLKSIGKVGCSGIRFVPLKCTSLIDSGVLERLTLTLTRTESLCDFSHNDEKSFASADDSEKFSAGLARFQNICDVARDNNLGILLDAEQSNRQPAIEVIAKILFEEYNIIGKNPVLYNTYQTYLKRTPAALLAGMDAAQSKGYVFAVKLVRGAYMHSERESFAKRIGDGAITGTEPVWETKNETDAAYNDAIRDILQRISNNDNNITSNDSRSIPHVMIASHNRTSIQLALARMAELNIANDNPNVHFAQILGMSDHLTVSLARSGEWIYEYYGMA
jgi:proline dehydrogenase